MKNRRSFADTSDPPPKVVIKSSRLHFLGYFLVTGGFAAVGGWMIENGNVLGWLVTGFCGPGSLLFLWYLLDPRPRVIIDDAGIFDRTYGFGCIAWSDILHVSVGSVHDIEFLCVEVQDPSLYLNRLSRWRRTLASWNRGLGFTEVTVNLLGITMSTAAVMEIVDRYLWHHLAQRQKDSSTASHAYVVKQSAGIRRHQGRDDYGLD